MLNYYKGTVFNTSAKTIVNTVNCVGVMGAGLALEFKLRYPEMFKEYKKKCEKNLVKIGRPYIYEYSNDLWIMNFPTKKHWKHKSKIEWIEAGLKYIKDNYSKRKIESIAFPKLGCNNGGLKWEEVNNLMKTFLSELDLEIIICLNEKKEPEGIEKDMVNLINQANSNQLRKKLGLNRNQVEVIFNNKPINRFWHIRKFNGIGKKSYMKIFRYFYNRVNTNQQKMVQMKLGIK